MVSSLGADSDFSGKVQSLENEVKELRRQVEDLRQRTSLVGYTEEVKQFKEYVCAKGHLYDTLPAGGICPEDGTPVKERMTYRKIKLARQESIADKISAALEEENKRKVLVGANATGILQQVAKSGVEGAGDRLFSSGAMNLLFVSRPAAFSTLFIELEGVGGRGPDESLGSLSGLNQTATRRSDPADKVAVREAWLRSEFWKRRIRLIIGEIDLSNYFDTNRVANDETSQFITSAFVNNPVLENPVNGPGLSLSFDPGGNFYIGGGAQNESNSGSLRYKDIYSIIETGARLHWFFQREGNYKIWVRNHGDSAGSSDALGISMDQRLSSQWFWFARWGATERGIAGRESAWSSGFAEAGPFGRVGDQWGAAVGQFEKRTVGREGVVDLFYRVFLTDHLTFTPLVQSIFDSVKEGGQSLSTPALVFGARTQINF